MADRRLQVFHAVARFLSFTKAAEALHMTQPAVTFQVKQLEEQFNTRLFDRKHSRVSLTEAGIVVYEYAERIMGMYGELQNRVGEISGQVRGLLTLGASTTIAEYLLPRILGDFKDLYPEVQVRLNVGNSERIISMVEDNTVDLAIVEGSVANKTLMVSHCCSDEMVLVMPSDHILNKKSKVSAADLLKYDFISREVGSGTREVINEYIVSAGLHPADLRITMELGSPESVKGAVEGGLGISIVSQSTVKKEVTLGSLVARPLEPKLTRPFVFVYQKQKFRSHVVAEFLEYAKKRCEQEEVGATTNVEAWLPA